MSIEAGRAYFRQFGMEDRVQEFTVSSATVDLAAKALGVEGENTVVQDGGRLHADPCRRRCAH